MLTASAHNRSPVRRNRTLLEEKHRTTGGLGLAQSYSAAGARGHITTRSLVGQIEAHAYITLCDSPCLCVSRGITRPLMRTPVETCRSRVPTSAIPGVLPSLRRSLRQTGSFLKHRDTEGQRPRSGEIDSERWYGAVTRWKNEAQVPRQTCQAAFCSNLSNEYRRTPSPLVVCLADSNVIRITFGRRIIQRTTPIQFVRLRRTVDS